MWIYFECLFCVREVWQDFIRVVVLLAEVQISTAANTRRTCQFEMLYEQNVEMNVKETIFKAQVYNDSEMTRVKQHNIFRDYLSVTANLKFAVSFLSACYKT